LQPELDITNQDIRLVRLAGLCHDLGHGPFSHAFEEWLHRRHINWKHEQMSCCMLEWMVDDNGLDCVDRTDLRIMEQMILGHMPEKDERAFLFEVISNSRNSIDVDKFDYLARDCYNLGIKSAYDSSRLMSFSRVINNQICFHAKAYRNTSSLCSFLFLYLSLSLFLLSCF
jgi:HD superfamily phosphohydrolase